MTIPAFPNYPANLPAEQTITSRARLTALGDGLIQERRWGLNPVRPTWGLTFELWPAGRAVVEAFLSARAADGQPFSWTAPGAAAATAWRCNQWTVDQFNGGRVMLQAKFERVFEVSPPELVAVPCGGNVITIITPPDDAVMWYYPEGEYVNGFSPDGAVASPADGYWIGETLYDAWDAAWAASGSPANPGTGNAAEIAAWAAWVDVWETYFFDYVNTFETDGSVIPGYRDRSSPFNSFSVSAISSNGSPLTYQWQFSYDNGATWANVSNGGISATASSAGGIFGIPSNPATTTWSWSGYTTGQFTTAAGFDPYTDWTDTTVTGSFNTVPVTLTATVSGATTSTISISNVISLEGYLFDLMPAVYGHTLARVVVSSTGATSVTSSSAKAYPRPD